MPPSDGQKKVPARRRFLSFLRKKEHQADPEDQESIVRDGGAVNDVRVSQCSPNCSDQAVDSITRPKEERKEKKKKIKRSRSLRESLVRLFICDEGKNRRKNAPNHTVDNVDSEPADCSSSPDKVEESTISGNGNTRGQTNKDECRLRTLSAPMSKEELKKRWFLEGQDKNYRYPYGNFTLDSSLEKSKDSTPQSRHSYSYSSFYRSTPLYASRTNYTLRPVNKDQLEDAESNQNENRAHLQEARKSLKKVGRLPIDHENESPSCVQVESLRSKNVSFSDEVRESVTETNVTACESGVIASPSKHSYNESGSETQSKNASSDNFHQIEDEFITECDTHYETSNNNEGLNESSSSSDLHANKKQTARIEGENLSDATHREDINNDQESSRSSSSSPSSDSKSALDARENLTARIEEENPSDLIHRENTNYDAVIRENSSSSSPSPSSDSKSALDANENQEGRFEEENSSDAIHNENTNYGPVIKENFISSSPSPTPDSESVFDANKNLTAHIQEENLSDPTHRENANNDQVVKEGSSSSISPSSSDSESVLDAKKSSTAQIEEENLPDATHRENTNNDQVVEDSSSSSSSSSSSDSESVLDAKKNSTAQIEEENLPDATHRENTNNDQVVEDNSSSSSSSSSSGSDLDDNENQTEEHNTSHPPNAECIENITACSDGILRHEDTTKKVEDKDGMEDLDADHQQLKNLIICNEAAKCHDPVSKDSEIHDLEADLCESRTTECLVDAAVESMEQRNAEHMPEECPGNISIGIDESFESHYHSVADDLDGPSPV